MIFLRGCRSAEAPAIGESTTAGMAVAIMISPMAVVLSVSCLIQNAMAMKNA